MSNDTPHIVLAGGGTGGHLFPGLAVAEQLRAILPDVRITMATGNKPFEQAHVAAAGFAHLRLPSHPLTGPAGTWRFVKENISGYRRARRFARLTKVSLVVGLGGYASLPMAWAATSSGIPLVLLEQNAFPGRVTRWFAPRAALICAAFAEARPHLKASGPVRVTGNPIRGGFLSAMKESERPTSPVRQLLILGGSGGSRTLNEQVPRALYKSRRNLIGWRIVHQTGPRDCDATKALYRKLDVEAIVVPFIERMPSVLRRTDLAICRSGGTTLAELAAAGMPALLLPWPKAANDHQRKNADVFVATGAAALLNSRDVKGRLDTAIAEQLAPLVRDSSRRENMAAAMRGLARPDAAWHIASMISQILSAKREASLASV